MIDSARTVRLDGSTRFEGVGKDRKISSGSQWPEEPLTNLRLNGWGSESSQLSRSAWV